MSDPREDRPDLSPESEAFVERVRDGYAPEEPSAARLQAFDVALRERLDEPQRQSWVRPALITATVGALIGWLLMPPEPRLPEEAPQTLASQEEPALPDPFDFDGFADPIETVPTDPADWEAELLSASELEELEAAGDDAFLPDEYQAIAGLFLDG